MCSKVLSMVEYWKKCAVICALGQFSDASDAGLGFVLIPLVIALWRLGPIEVGWLGAAFTLGAMMGGLISGPLMDYVGRKRMWVLGNALAAISYFLSATSINWVQFAVYRFIAGFTVGTCFAAYFTLIPEEVPSDKRSTIAGLGLALNTCGILFLSTLLALTGVVPWITWQVMVIVVGAIDLVMAVLGQLFLREPPIWVERRKLMKEGKIAGEEKTSLKAMISPEVRKMFIYSMLLGISYGFVTLSVAGSGNVSFFQSAVLRFSPSTVGVVYIIATLINVVLVAVTGSLGDKLGRLNTILIVGIISLIASQLLFRTPYFFGVGESISVIAFSLIMYSLWVWAERPLDSPVRVWVSEVIPTAARGSVQGILDFVKSLIGSVLSIVIGYLAAAIGLIEGYSLMPLLGGIFALAVVTMLKRKGLETKGKALA